MSVERSEDIDRAAGEYAGTVSTRTWFRKALIAATILVGPILCWLIAIDGVGTRLGAFGFTLLIVAAFTLGYAMLLRFPATRGGVVRLAMAIVLGLLAFAVAVVVLWFIGIWLLDPSFKNHDHPQDEIIALVALFGAALAGAAVWRWVQRTGVRWSYELGAVLAAALPPIAILALRAHGNAHFNPSDWPILLGFVPLVLVAWRFAPAFSTRALIEILLLTALPFYVVKAVDDAARGVATPLLWPYRVVTDHMPPVERAEFIRGLEYVAEDETVRLGERWYAFADASGTGEARPGTRPDRLVSLQLRVRTAALDLPELPERGTIPAGVLRIGLNDEVGTPQTVHTTTEYEDLIVHIEMPDVPDWPPEDTVRQRVLEYLGRSEVPPPP